MTAVPPRARDALAAFTVIAAWLAATIGLRPLMLPDEGRYAGVAWEMLRSGDWLTPTLDGLPFFHKPPLFYWITAASLHVFGAHPAAARAASLLGATALAFGLYLFLRRWSGRTSARAGVLALATAPMFFLGAQFANLDMLVAGCIGTTLLLAVHATWSAEQGSPYRAAAAGAWAVAALGVLAKGLIGFVLPALVLLAWALVSRRPRRLGALLSPLGLLLFLAIVLPWHVAMAQRHPEFLHYYVVVQHFQRFGQGGFNNPQPFWFYPVVLALFGLPWTLWLWQARRPAFWRDPARGDLRRLMAAWFVVVVGFFSLPSSKLIGYVLPALAPLAVLVAEAARDAGSTRRWRFGAAAAAALCVAAVGAFAVLPRHDGRALAQALRTHAGAGDPVVFAGAYFYDVPLLAQLRAPVRVVEDWGDPAIRQRDNWRRELADAAGFAPAAGAALLVPFERLAASLCAAPVTWLIATDAARARLPWLGALQPVARSDNAALWRITPSTVVVGTQDCRETPSDGPASR